MGWWCGGKEEGAERHFHYLENNQIYRLQSEIKADLLSYFLLIRIYYTKNTNVDSLPPLRRVRRTLKHILLRRNLHSTNQIWKRNCKTRLDFMKLIQIKQSLSDKIQILFYFPNEYIRHMKTNRILRTMIGTPSGWKLKN